MKINKYGVIGAVVGAVAGGIGGYFAGTKYSAIKNIKASPNCDASALEGVEQTDANDIVNAAEVIIDEEIENG